MLLKCLLAQFLLLNASSCMETDSAAPALRIDDYDETAADFIDEYDGPFDDVLIMPSHFYKHNQYIVKECDNSHQAPTPLRTPDDLTRLGD